MTHVYRGHNWCYFDLYMQPHRPVLIRQCTLMGYIPTYGVCRHGSCWYSLYDPTIRLEMGQTNVKNVFLSKSGFWSLYACEICSHVTP